MKEESSALSRRELGLILAFWLLYALLSSASRLFDMFGHRAPWSSGHLVVALIEALTWALLTPLVFELAARFGAESGRRRRWMALFVLLGLGVAALFGVGGRVLRGALVAPPVGPPEQHPGPPLWFGFLYALVLYLGVLAAGLARAYSLRYRARQQQAVELQAQLAKAHLEALRRQLDPHFLFNTLNAVSSLVERDPRGVRRMIARLSELLRYSLEAQDGPEIPLKKELDLLSRYLDIMQVRFQGRLQVQQCIADDVLDALVPTMVLQPLVENAIRHGVEKLESGGHIAIEALPQDQELVLRVSDNGPGPVANPLESGDGGKGGGVGLRNTIARLERLYGTRQRFALGPADDGDGTTAEIRIPLRRAHAV